MKIVDGIHKVDGMKRVNCYLVESGEGLILVDSGMPGNADTILRNIGELGKKPEDLKFILLTHSDIDHFGSAGEVRARTGAKIAVHEADVNVLAGRQPPRKLKGFLGRFLRFMSRFMKVAPVEPDIRLKDGDRIGGLLVVHTPGHTSGSVVFLDEARRAVFSGDTLLSDRAGNLRPPRLTFALDEDRVLRSAERIKAMDFKVLLPGHGTPRVS